jgi:uncharacterized protein
MKNPQNYLYPIIKPIGSYCNLSCSYCYYKDRHLGEHLMKEKVLEIMIKKLLHHNKGFAPFLWHGGEPLLCGINFYEKAIFFQNKFKTNKHKIQNQIQTNATLINNDWIDFFKKNNFKIGTSIDGPREIHEHFRPNSFDRIMHSLKLLKDANLSFGCICVVNSHNYKYPLAVYDFLKESLHQSVSIKPCIEMAENGQLSKFSVNPIDYAQFMIQIFDKWFEEDNPNFIIREFENFIMGLIGEQPTLCCNRVNGCQRYVTINYNGDVYTCDSFVNDDYQAYFYGNIANEPIQKIMHSNGAKKSHSVETIALLDCKKCKWLNICGGGCINFHTHLSEKYKKQYCSSRKIIIEHLKQFVS